MKKLVVLAAALATQFALIPAHAAEEAKKPPTAQQQKMADCNKQATGMKGDERKKFMSNCLSAKPEAAASAPAAAKAPEAKAAAAEAKPATQQEKMAACNKLATGKKGDERKAFMSECLSAKPDAAASAPAAKPAK
ncbi:hypothetical protein GCM10025771_06160 [Niveibacterium umoris]|uniref:Phosphate starvation-inducible protein PsiF n=1 Tax=Niveibacterium umoris TaxID=1193620 RepID=A0A840BSN7_9RHOO|nr:PsiF family protein [Niveibacterium umoris]MBB4013836.1 hypothetical protein [Niveibacterium umoris]